MPINTKEAIAGAFQALEQEKSIDKITVKDLVEKLGISRQTFYYHFQDTMDVLEWIIDRQMSGLLAQCIAAGDLKEAIDLFVTTALAQRNKFHRLFSSSRRDAILQMLMQAFRSYLRELFRRQPAQVPILAGDLELAIDFSAYGIAGLILEHSQRPDADAKELAGQIYRLLSGRVFSMQP